VQQRHAGEHVAAVHALLQHARAGGQLGLVVDALDLAASASITVTVPNARRR